MSEIQKLKDIVYARLNLSEEDHNIDKLTLEQLDFITHDINTPCYLEACPGSGKTEVVGVKAAYEIASWNQYFSGFAILSFTNNATNEIIARVTKYAGIRGSKHPHFIGTIDSWIYNYIFLPFAHSIIGYEGQENDKSPRAVIDNSSNADFLLGFKTDTPYVFQKKNNLLQKLPIRPNQYFYDIIEKDFIINPFVKHFIKLQDLIDTPAFQEFKRDKPWLTNSKIKTGFFNAKKKFWKAGFYTFQDIELLSYFILKKKTDLANKLARRFPFIIIDECQDLSPSQIQFLDILKNNECKIHFIGDLGQAIYQFRKVNPNNFLKYVEEESIEKKFLTDNFRSNQNIVNVFSEILPNSKKIKGNEPIFFLPNCFIWEYEDNDDFKKLPEYFCDYIKKLNEDNPENKIFVNKSAILGRSWSLLSKLYSSDFKDSNIFELLAASLHFWKKKSRNSNDLHLSIFYFAKFLSNAAYKGKGTKRDYFCPENISSIEWRMFISNLLENHTHKLFPFTNKSGDDLTWSQWAREARIFIEKIWELLPINPYSNIDEVKRKLVTKGKGGAKVKETLISDTFKSDVRITSIHDVKGETLDAVLLISAKDMKSNGGHFEQWFKKNPKDSTEKEYKRFGYVACSRPKHLLILAVPKLNTSQRKMIEELGVKIKKMNTNLLL